jgi:hypothetical protein
MHDNSINAMWHSNGPFEECASCSWINDRLRDMSASDFLIERKAFMQSQEYCGLELESITGDIERELHPDIARNLADFDADLKTAFTPAAGASVPIREIWARLAPNHLPAPPDGARDHFEDTLLLIRPRTQVRDSAHTIMQEPVSHYAAKWRSSCIPVVSHSQGLIEGQLYSQKGGNCKLRVDVQTDRAAWPHEQVFRRLQHD